jgi:sugar O-acyltransferase (sialic acid O-acetyltransferase NeuD family)
VTKPAAIVLYAVGSPLVTEVEETCRRRGLPIAAAIRNIAGPHYLLDSSLVRERSEVDIELLGHPCIVPLFGPSRRRNVVAEAAEIGFAMADTLIDPTAIVAASAVFGCGGYVNAGVVIGAAARFGSHAIVNRAGSVGHHADIGDFVSIGPGVTIAGFANIGDGVMIGAGAVILPNVEIGIGCVIGAGAVVTCDVPAGSLAVGNPARVAREAAEDHGT